jgi:serine O-acetyltransferase
MAIQRRTAPARRHLALADRLLRARPRNGARGGTLGALPSPADIALLVEQLMSVLFPGWGRSPGAGAVDEASLREPLAEVLAALEGSLEAAVYLGLRRRCAASDTERMCHDRAKKITSRFLAALPDVRTQLIEDVEAAYASDPAATGFDEIVACYPGLYAIAVYRAANRLLREGAAIVPRMMTEHAHARTGIDIHPGATIGRSFFMDHGTGTVIGETTIIGAQVRIYQGVTLGALSVRRRDHQHPQPTGKRHPTIEDGVIIYANATILGGETVIGRGAVIGGNAWITYSVPAGIRVGVGT